MQSIVYAIEIKFLKRHACTGINAGICKSGYAVEIGEFEQEGFQDWEGLIILNKPMYFYSEGQAVTS
ncbi:MAG: hypothetical protein IPF68_20500 [Bacteroidales bacterium]|nr:hypothetical protein [Bacteroidales bacterium]